MGLMAAYSRATGNTTIIHDGVGQVIGDRPKRGLVALLVLATKLIHPLHKRDRRTTRSQIATDPAGATHIDRLSRVLSLEAFRRRPQYVPPRRDPLASETLHNSRLMHRSKKASLSPKWSALCQ
jgi:hypothetical protein